MPVAPWPALATQQISAKKKFIINLENHVNKGTPPSEKRPDKSGNSKKRENQHDLGWFEKQNEIFNTNFSKNYKKPNLSFMNNKYKGEAEIDFNEG